MKSIFIFRRDLRLYDNIALSEAIKQSDIIIPIFIFTPEQIINNKYKSNNAIQFMLESLDDLNHNLKKLSSKLYLFFGEPHKIIEKLIETMNVETIFANRDYTNYAKKRDAKISKICQDHNIPFNLYDDYLLQKPGTVMTGSNTPYVKFTPFLHANKTISVSVPVKINFANKLFNGKINNQYKYNINNYNEYLAFHGGRKNALKILNNIIEFKTYNKKRDDLTYQTTHLSAYIKFGCVSIREVYHTIKNKLGKNNKLIDQLYWHDFYTLISHYYPHIYNGAMRQKYNKLKWSYDTDLFNKWKKGLTGYPIVDAGMRQLNTTGFMHNRARLITSSFLIKILHINWQEGEKYFATQLIDYDPAVNNGNWQWSASTGTDSQPYFRIFNPWLQSKKHDPDAEYIKKWTPELSNVPAKDIHNWADSYKNYKINYPPPCVDFDIEKQKTLKMYQQVV